MSNSWGMDSEPKISPRCFPDDETCCSIEISDVKWLICIERSKELILAVCCLVFETRSHRCNPGWAQNGQEWWQITWVTILKGLIYCLGLSCMECKRRGSVAKGCKTGESLLWLKGLNFGSCYSLCTSFSHRAFLLVICILSYTQVQDDNPFSLRVQPYHACI